MRDPSVPARPRITPGRAAFIIALVLTLILVIMGVTGTPWPRWLLALTNIL
jgi:hypothetical protein